VHSDLATSVIVPSRYAVYCDSTTGILAPYQSTNAVVGSVVVSDRNGLLSTLPTWMTDRTWLTGNRGFVIAVGFEKVGHWRSTRLPVGAQPLRRSQLDRDARKPR
jgi:hypothetical protein